MQPLLQDVYRMLIVFSFWLALSIYQASPRDLYSVVFVCSSTITNWRIARWGFLEVEKIGLDKVFLDKAHFRNVTGLVPVAKCGMSWDPETPRQASCFGKGTSRELCTQDPHLLPVWTLPSQSRARSQYRHMLYCAITCSCVYVPIGPFWSIWSIHMCELNSTVHFHTASILTSQEASEGPRGCVCCRGSCFLDFERT